MNELVRKIQAHDREGFIALFRKLDSKERFVVLNQQTSDGKTLLHYAAQSGDIEVVRHLLGLEIQLDIADLAENTAADLAQDAGHAEIAVLLKTRMEWRDKNPSRLPLNKALNLIEGSYHAVEGGKNKPLVLVLGETGVGKSTLINYLNGATYQLTGIPGFSQTTELRSGVDIAQVGHNPVVSETLYPQVLNIDCGYDSLHMADLAGINGTREPVVELAGTVSTHLLSKMASAIKSILFVVDINSLNAGRGGAFRQTIKTLNKILQGDFEGKLSRSVFFAITKLPSGVKISDVIPRYIAPLQSLLESQMLQGNLSREDIEMHRTVKLMMSARDRMFAPDVCDDGRSRKELFKALVNSPEISARSLDLLHMDKHQESFIEMLTFLSGEYLHLSDEINKRIPSQLEQREQTLSKNVDNIKNWESEIATAKKAQEEGMTPEKAIQMMTERQASVRALEKKQVQLIEERTRLTVSEDMTQAFIKDIDVDTPVEYGKSYRFNHIGELQIKQSTQSNPAPSTVGKEIGSKVGTFLATAHPGLAVASEVGGIVYDLFQTRDIPAPEIVPMPGTGTYVFENSGSPAPGNILDVLTIGNCGCFGRPDLQGNVFNVAYNYPLGESATAEVVIKIATRDLPDNKVRIERSKNDIKANAEKLSHIDAELAELAKQIEVLIGEMNGFQVEGISAAAQQEALKTQIQQREEWIKTAHQTIEETHRQVNSLEKQRDTFALQLNVNKDMFTTLCKVIHILRLDNDPQYNVLNEFVKLFSETSPADTKAQSHSPTFFAKHSNEQLRAKNKPIVSPVSQGGPSCISQPK